MNEKQLKAVKRIRDNVALVARAAGVSETDTVVAFCALGVNLTSSLPPDKQIEVFADFVPPTTENIAAIRRHIEKYENEPDPADTIGFMKRVLESQSYRLAS